jgi:hypothetical protein
VVSSKQLVRGLLASSALAVLLATVPVQLAPDLVSLELRSAIAKGGDGGGGGGNSGSGGGGHGGGGGGNSGSGGGGHGGGGKGGGGGSGGHDGGDDHGGNSGRGGGGDRGGDDHGGRSGGDDSGGDDRGGRSGGDDDRGGRSGRNGGDDDNRIDDRRDRSDLRERIDDRRSRDDDRHFGRDDDRGLGPDATKVEIAGDHIEVTFPDGTRQEIENGRFEQKNAQGRTVVERPASAADLDRLRGVVAGVGGTSFERTAGASKVEVNGDHIEVTFADGTRQEIENGRFEQKNAQGRTVVERPATPADADRLQALAQGTAAIMPALAPGGGPTRVEIAGSDIEVTHADGWREEIEQGRYELKDPENNTVVERAATSADRSRLRGALGL